MKELKKRDQVSRGYLHLCSMNFQSILIYRYFVFIKLMEATLHGMNGVNVLFHVAEEGALVTDNVPTLCHNMVGRIVRALDHLLKQKSAIQMDVQVHIFLDMKYFSPWYRLES